MLWNVASATSSARHKDVHMDEGKPIINQTAEKAARKKGLLFADEFDEIWLMFVRNSKLSRNKFRLHRSCAFTVNLSKWRSEIILELSYWKRSRLSFSLRSSFIWSLQVHGWSHSAKSHIHWPADCVSSIHRLQYWPYLNFRIICDGKDLRLRLRLFQARFYAPIVVRWKWIVPTSSSDMTFSSVICTSTRRSRAQSKNIAVTSR